jgi:hypothetical protein
VFEVRPLEPDQMEELIAFLCRVFLMPREARSVQPSLLRWKGFDPHPFWPAERGASRTFAAWNKGQIVSTGCLTPLLYRYDGITVSGHGIIDWAADRKVPGGGVLIYQTLLKLTDVQVGIGGSDDAVRVMPKMRFDTRQTIGTYRRLSNPLLREDTPKDWKTPARLGRDLLRRASQGPLSGAGRLTARKVGSFGGLLGKEIPMPEGISGDRIVSVRTPELLDYMLQCPTARMEGYVIDDEWRPRGYCILSRVGMEARIADLWIQAGPEAGWREAVSLATELAESQACGSVTTRASAPTELRAALVEQGYRLEGESPFFVKDPQKKLPPGVEVQFSMIDNDAAYL